MNQTNSMPQILLVEDSIDQAVLLTRWLTDFVHAKVTHVVTAEAALASLEKTQFSLVLMDVELPGLDGIDAVAKVKRLRPNACVVIMSAHAKLDFAIRAVRSQADDFLPKPMTRAMFVDVVRQHLDSVLVRSLASARTVVAIGAHPDDVEIGCGGTLLLHREKGDRVVVLTLSNGDRGGDPRGRRDESQASAAALGATLRLGGLTDTAIHSGAETIDIISEVLREFKPDVVYTHSQNDVHQDHRAAHEATMVAARQVHSILCYQSPSSMPTFMPSMYVDISPVIDMKLSLLRNYVSQVTRCAYLEEDLLRATARYWGRYSPSAKYVEPLEAARIQDYVMPSRPSQSGAPQVETPSGSAPASRVGEPKGGERSPLSARSF